MLNWISRQTDRPRIDDISALGKGRENFLPPTAENMRSSLAQWGVVIIRDAFPVSAVSGLVEAAIRHGDRVTDVRRSGGDFDFPDFYKWNPGAQSCEVTALDPETAGRSDDFNSTSAWGAVSKSPAVSILREVLGTDAWYASARARVVIPGMDKGGRLPLHLERRAHPYEGVHNLWTPLLPEGKFVNVDCPGLQLFAGRLPFFQALSPETEPDILAYMSSLGPQSLSPEAPGDEHGFFLRPKVKTGDVIIFSGFVPHGSYLPPEPGITRVCFDMRTFPGEQRPEKVAHVVPRKLAIN